MDIGSLIGNPLLWLFGLFIIIFIAYMLKSYISAFISSLFYDYVIDGVLSFADNFVMGIGLTGFDVGDWIASIIIFMRYYKQLGWGWALLCALEAANFGFSIIPGIGEPIEWFFNFFPIITIVIAIKQYNANSTYSSIKEYYDFIKEEDNDAAEKWKGAVDKIHQYYESLDYTDLAKEGSGITEGLHAEVGKIIMKKLNTAQKYVIETLEQENQIPKEQIEQIKSAVDNAMQTIDTDWQGANTMADSILQSVSSLVYQAQSKKKPEETAETIDEFKEAV